MNTSESGLQHALAAASILVAICVLFYIALSDPLAGGPFLLSLIIFFLVWPMRDNPIGRSVLYTTAFLLTFYILIELRVVLVPFIIAFMIAYLVAPLMNTLRQFHVPSGISSFVVTTVFIGIIVLLVFFLGPIIGEQSKSLVSQSKYIINFIPNLLENPDLRGFLFDIGIDPNVLRNRIEAEIVPEIQRVLFESSIFENYIPSFFSIVVNFVISVIFLPFLMFYFFKDYEDLLSKLRGLIPNDKRNSIEFHSRKLQRIIATYVRGQLLVAFIGGLLVYFPFMIAEVPYAIVLAIGYTFLSLIPYVGVIVMLVVAVIFSTIDGQFLFHGTVAITTILSVAAIQNFILVPKILGDQVDLHPVVLILSISVFGYFLGILGMLLAIPITAAINVYFRDWLDERNLLFALKQFKETEQTQTIKTE